MHARDAGRCLGELELGGPEARFGFEPAENRSLEQTGMRRLAIISWLCAIAAAAQVPSALARAITVQSGAFVSGVATPANQRLASQSWKPIHHGTKPKPRPTSFLFGLRSIQPHHDSTVSGIAEAFPVLNGATGSIASVMVYVDSRSSARALMVGLYTNDQGHPGRRMTSGALLRPRPGKWNVVNVKRTTVAGGREYWLALLGKGGKLRFRDRANCTSQTYAARGMNSMPATWQHGRRMRGCQLSAFARGKKTYVKSTQPAPPPEEPVPPPSTASPSGIVGVAGEPSVGCTVALNPGANLQSVLKSAAPGSTICLNGGGWSDPKLSGIDPSAPITIAATPGQTVTMDGLSMGYSTIGNLIFEGIHFSSGISETDAIAGGLVFQFNDLENIDDFAFYFYPGGNSHGNTATQDGVTIQYNQIDHVGQCMEADQSNSGPLTNFAFNHNVCGPDIGFGQGHGGNGGHYIQVGHVSGFTFDNNAFEGPATPSPAEMVITST